MKAHVVKIGNSNGIIIPSDWLKKLNLKVKSVVSIDFKDEEIIIKPAPRQGWDLEAKQMHLAGDDTLLIPDVFEDEEFEKNDIEWK